MDWPPNYIVQMVNYLRAVDHPRFVSAAETFALQDWSSLPEERLRAAYYDVITAGRYAALPQLMCSYPAGTIFWRVRNPLEGDSIASPTLQTRADLWAPPPEFVSAPGRLNRVGESILYTCPADPILAITEARVEPEADFYLIKYVATRPVQVCLVPGPEPTMVVLPDDVRQTYETIFEFHRREFTREHAGPGVYTVSEFLVKDMFDLPPDLQDGWCYPPVVGPPRVNVACRPENAETVLNVVGAARCRWRAHATGDEINLYRCTDGVAGVDGFAWSGWPSGPSRELFSEFG